MKQYVYTYALKGQLIPNYFKFDASKTNSQPRCFYPAQARKRSG